MMISNPQSGVQCQVTPRSFSASLTYQVGLLFLLGVVLSAGCVSKEQYEAEKVRGLNFQRLLAQEEKRADTLNAQLAQKDKELEELNSQLKETTDKIASLESQNRDLTVELNALKEQSRHQVEQEPVSDSPVPSTAPTVSKDTSLSEPSLSDPFMSEEELRNLLESGSKAGVSQAP